MKTFRRRDFICTAGAVVVATTFSLVWIFTKRTSAMYGLIGKITAVPGQRDALIEILLEGMAGMPGCLSYVVAEDPTDTDALWVTEVWDSKANHEASLSLPSVRQAIAQGRDLIASFGERFETQPVGGYGLASHEAR